MVKQVRTHKPPPVRCRRNKRHNGTECSRCPNPPRKGGRLCGTCHAQDMKGRYLATKAKALQVLRELTAPDPGVDTIDAPPDAGLLS